MADLDSSPSYHQAMALLSSGDPQAAHNTLRNAIHLARQTHGEHSHETAAAWVDLARLQATLDDAEGALDSLRQSIQFEPRTDAAVRDRLSYLLNLGQLLLREGHLEEAETVLRQNLEGRENFYGTEHPGYAFGLEPMADLAWIQGDLQEAIDLIEDAAEILWEDENPQVASVLALRACLHHAAGREAPVFADVRNIPDDWIEAVVEETRGRIPLMDPELARNILVDLIDWVGEVRIDQPAALIPLYGDLAEVARHSGDHKGRRDHLQTARTLADSMGETELSLQLAQAMALAEHDAGNEPAAEALYRESAALAQNAGLAPVQAKVLRNFGIFLADTDRRVEAEAVLRQALDTALDSDDPVLIARCQTALGIFLQHGDRPKEARPFLEAGVAALDTEQNDLLHARSHLAALDKGEPCGCRRSQSALSEQLLRLVRPHVPEGLVTAIQLDPANGVSLELSREPTPDESKRLQDAIHEALKQMQNPEA